MIRTVKFKPKAFECDKPLNVTQEVAGNRKQ